MKNKTVALLLSSILLVACGESQATQQEQVIGTIEESTSADDSLNTQPASVETEEESKLAKVGEFVEGDTWKISLLDAKAYDSIKDEYFETNPEVEGNKFVVLFFEVENISSNDEHFNMFYFESYVDGYATQSKMLMSDVEGYSTLSGDVAAGKKLKGYVAFEVNPNWQEIEYSYKNHVATSDKIATFLVTPDQLSE